MAEKGAVESVLGFIGDQQKRIEDKKKQEAEAAEVAAEAAKVQAAESAERNRVALAKAKEFAVKHKKWLLVALAALVLAIAVGVWAESADAPDANTVEVDFTSESMVGENYDDVVAQLKAAGFTNITTQKNEDLIIGFLVDDGDVEVVRIAGSTDYSSGDRFAKNAEVVVRYHTFPEKETSEPEIAPVVDAAPTEQELADQALESTFPVERAKRAAVVAVTNGTAIDVFKSDGNTYDVPKFHSYSDTSGDVSAYFQKVISWGTWSAKDGTSWHVEELSLEHAAGALFNASLDVKLVGSNYVISNVKGSYGGDPEGAAYLGSASAPFWTVPAKLIKVDRSQAAVDALDHSGDLDKQVARSAFENYGKAMFPYGFRCAWILGLINEEQASDGSWFFKVDVKITNEYGAKMSAIAEGKVSGTTSAPVVEDFYAN